MFAIGILVYLTLDTLCMRAKFGDRIFEER